jgi:drug/metabolite transporter (DMT)-like permease
VVAVVIFMLLPLSLLVIWGAGRLDPGRVAILLLFEVLAASVSAAILTDEPFGTRTFVGGALILTAAALEGLGPDPSA